MDTSTRSSHRSHRTITRFAFAAGVVFVAGGGIGAALATPPSGTLSRTDIAKARVTDPISIQTHSPVDFHIQQVTVDPGATSGWHAHPGAEYTIVKNGSVTLIKAPGCEPRTVTAGEGFFIPGGTNHFARNDSDAPVELWVTYTVPADSPLRVDQAGACEGK